MQYIGQRRANGTVFLYPRLDVFIYHAVSTSYTACRKKARTARTVNILSFIVCASRELTANSLAIASGYPRGYFRHLELLRDF